MFLSFFLVNYVNLECYDKIKQYEFHINVIFVDVGLMKDKKIIV